MPSTETPWGWPKVSDFKRTPDCAIDALLPHLAGRQVMDFGCGDGHFMSRIAEVASVRGIELDDALAAQAIAWLGSGVTRGSLFDAELRPGEVVYCYLTPLGMRALAEKLASAEVWALDYSIPERDTACVLHVADAYLRAGKPRERVRTLYHYEAR